MTQKSPIVPPVVTDRTKSAQLVQDHVPSFGFDEASLSEDAARLGGKAEFEVFAGFSHFMAFEVREDGAKGHDLVTARMDKFYAGLN